MARDKKEEHPLSKLPSPPMWKTFMITNLDKVERVSGTIHARLSGDKAEPGSFAEKFAPKGTEPVLKEMGRKDTIDADVFPDALPEHMRKEEKNEEPESRPRPKDFFEGREVILRPVISDAQFPLPPKPEFKTLPTGSADMKAKLDFRAFGLSEPRGFMLRRKTK